MYGVLGTDDSKQGRPKTRQMRTEERGCDFCPWHAVTARRGGMGNVGDLTINEDKYARSEWAGGRRGNALLTYRAQAWITMVRSTMRTTASRFDAEADGLGKAQKLQARADWGGAAKRVK